MTQKDSVYFENNSWNFICKKIDKRTNQIRYLLVSGYADYETALNDYEESEKKFNEELLKMRVVSGCGYTFKEFLDYWIKNIVCLYASRNCKKVYQWTIYKVIMPNIQYDISLTDLTVEYLDDLLLRCSKVSECSGYQCRRMLHNVINVAVKEGILTKNIVEETKSYPCNGPKLVIYSQEQIKKLLQLAYDFHNHYLEVLLGIFCGLRPGEISGLKYGDINFKEKTLTVSRQLEKVNGKSSFMEKAPKTKNSYRIMRVPDIILQEVQNRYQENCDNSKKSPHFQKENIEFLSINANGEFKGKDTINFWLRKATCREGLPAISQHGLRHLYATLLLESDVPIEKISKLLGHSSVSTTFNVYCGIIDGIDHTKNYIERNLQPVDDTIVHS